MGITSSASGFGRSAAKQFTIPAGQRGGNVAPVDLGRGFAYIVIKCLDCNSIQPGTTYGLKVGESASDTLADLYNSDGTGLWVSETLPTGGSTYRRLVLPAAMAQRVQIILSQPCGGDIVPFVIYGSVEAVKS